MDYRQTCKELGEALDGYKNSLEKFQELLKEAEKHLEVVKDQIRLFPVEEKSDRRKLITKKE